jgi:hypothetical protein
MVSGEREEAMKVIPVTLQSEVPSPHVMHINSTPEAAALATAEKWGQSVDTVYTLGKRCFVPVTVSAEHFWNCMSNEV